MEFLAWAAMLAGNKGAALAAAGQIETFLDEAPPYLPISPHISPRSRPSSTRRASD